MRSIIASFSFGTALLLHLRFVTASPTHLSYLRRDTILSVRILPLSSYSLSHKHHANQPQLSCPGQDAGPQGQAEICSSQYGWTCRNGQADQSNAGLLPPGSTSGSGGDICHQCTCVSQTQNIQPPPSGTFGPPGPSSTPAAGPTPNCGPLTLAEYGVTQFDPDTLNETVQSYCTSGSSPATCDGTSSTVHLTGGDVANVCVPLCLCPT